MKTWKHYFILFILLASTVTCFGWEITGEANTHGPINDAAVFCFSTNFVNSTKLLDEQIKFDGIAWHNGSDENIILNNGGVPRRETFKMWVKIGGIDADVESEDAERVVLRDNHTNVVIRTFLIGKPLRHFYDPTCKENERYLTDFKDSIKNQFENPKIDHVQWALNKTENHWSFDQGLRLYKAAMENKKSDDLDKDIAGFHGYFTSDEKNIRENLFSASFRALGETLHCAGDLCVPAHVRDDSHGGTAVGGLDPIENNIKFVNAQTILSQHSKLPLNDFLNKQKTVKEILSGCAELVNKSFFSNDTICNDSPKVGPSTDIKKIYKTPSFSKKDLIQVGNGTKVFHVYADFLGHDGQPIILAQLEITSYLGMYTTETYSVPTDAAEKQASVLLPLAAAAGGEIIDRFLPTMKLTLEISKDQNNGTVLNGSLVHEIDKDIEWKNIGAIKYNGEGEIKVNSSTVATATFVDGVMNTVKGMSFKANDKVQLVVKAGALIHNSNTVIISDAGVITPAITLTCLKSSNFTQLLQKVAVEDSRRVGYIGTLKPEIMATVLAEGNDTIAYNWWCDDATGTWVSDYFTPYTYSTFPYHDRPIFSQDGITPKDLKPKQIENTKYFCAPAGNHTLHIRAYYGSGAYQGLLESPVDKSSQNYVQKDVTFTVTAATSPIIRYKGATPWEEISFKETAVEENFTGPEWAPNTWKRLKFKFDGPYTYYPDYQNKPEIKVTGNYTNGIRSGKWIIKENSYQYRFDYDSDGKIISLAEYDNSGNLKVKYTDCDLVSPSFSVANGDLTTGVAIVNAHVETFGDPKEEYNLVNGTKEGAYSYSTADGKTISGQYSNGDPSGTWTYYDPSKTPSDWTVTH